MSDAKEADERSFAWLCRLLSSARTPLRVLETVFLRAEKVDCVVFTDTCGNVKRASAHEADVHSLHQALSRYQRRYESEKEYRREPPGLCFCSLRGERFLITLEALSQIADRRLNVSHSTFLQECRSDATPYTFTLSWRAGAYFPQYRVGQLLGKNSQVLHKLVDAVKVILTIMRQVKCRTVTELSLDFHRGESGEYWLCDAHRCLLGQSLAPEHWRVSPAELTERSSEHSDSRELPETRDEARVPPTRHSLGRRSTSQRSLSYYQADFQELILRKYLKEKKLELDLLSQPASLLRDFERELELPETAALHARNSEVDSSCKPHLPVLRKPGARTSPLKSSRRQHKARTTV